MCSVVMMLQIQCYRGGCQRPDVRDGSVMLSPTASPAPSNHPASATSSWRRARPQRPCPIPHHRLHCRDVESFDCWHVRRRSIFGWVQQSDRDRSIRRDAGLRRCFCSWHLLRRRLRGSGRCSRRSDRRWCRSFAVVVAFAVADFTWRHSALRTKDVESSHHSQLITLWI